MKEVIYTIPVNTAFDGEDGCPFCRLYEKLEATELELILGASMMEPDVRLETNKHGFCSNHFDKMFSAKNRLGLGLIIESHLGHIADEIKPGGILAKDIASKPCGYIERLNQSCYICGRIESNLEKMFNTAVVLWQREEEFRKKFDRQKMFCLPHYRELLCNASGTLQKKDAEKLIRAADKIESAYLGTLREDVSWFCKKFDYRYDKEPWNNSRDAIERALLFLNGVMR